jgi:hypothetical protein
MSNGHSSFEKDKKFFDNWRSFLNKGASQPHAHKTIKKEDTKLLKEIKR